MREIKFRVWDIESPCMMYWEEVQNIWESEGYHVAMFLGDHYTSMQYTGLKDKNGKEIYEGDILSNNIGDLATVVWLNAAFRFQWDVHLIPTQGNIKEWSEMKIIGNIHENPELLK